MKLRSLSLLSLFLLPQLTFAHSLTYTTASFSSGFFHPFLGWDHLLAMVAVGLWAVQLGAFWQLPLTFVLSMALGGTFGFLSITFTFLELGLLVSVFLLGLFLYLAKSFSLNLALSITALIGMLHGLAHGLEMSPTQSGLFYGFGFLFATSLLHGLGLLSATLLQSRAFSWGIRWTGAIIMLLSLGLAYKV